MRYSRIFFSSIYLTNQMFNFSQRAIRRQEVGLLVKFLAVNRTLQEIKRNIQRPVVKHGGQNKKNRRSFTILQAPEQSRILSDQLIRKNPFPTESTIGNNPKITTQSVPITTNGKGRYTCKLQLRTDIKLQDQMSNSKNFNNEIETINEDSKDGLCFIQERKISKNYDKQVETDVGRFHDGDDGSAGSDRAVHGRSRPCSYDMVLSRRESGYSSSSDMDYKSKGRTRSWSSSSYSSTLSSFSSSSLSLVLSPSMMTSRNSFSSQLTLSPSISASSSSLMF